MFNSNKVLDLVNAVVKSGCFEDNLSYSQKVNLAKLYKYIQEDMDEKAAKESGGVTEVKRLQAYKKWVKSCDDFPNYLGKTKVIDGIQYFTDGHILVGLNAGHFIGGTNVLKHENTFPAVEKIINMFDAIGECKPVHMYECKAVQNKFKVGGEERFIKVGEYWYDPQFLIWGLTFLKETDTTGDQSSIGMLRIRSAAGDFYVMPVKHD